MLFSDLLFLYLFLPVLFIFYFTSNNIIYKNIVLIFFSLLFYSWGEPFFVLLLIASVAVNYFFGLIIDHFNQKGNRKTVKFFTAAIITADLAMLCAYKYLPFIAANLNFIPGVSINLPRTAIPLGISFFTFQLISYIVDVRRGTAAVQCSFYKLLLYIAMFPQLIAGPIIRYGDISVQIDERRADIAIINEGIFRFSLGLAKKVLLANQLGAAANQLLGASFENATVLSAWAGALFFALYIYYDFSGYSDMAIGLGKMFGFSYKENFDYPYISRSAGEFWRRWHISLGSFFRDYVYIPLGGNRRFWLRNVLIVWLLTGLWHGASWNFIAWGLYYAVLLMLEKGVRTSKAAEKIPYKIAAAFSHIYMIAATLIGWTVFYYTDGFFARVGLMFGAAMSGSSVLLYDVFEKSVIGDNIILLAVAVILATPIVPFVSGKIRSAMEQKPNVLYFVLRIIKTVFSVTAVAVSTVMLTGSTYTPFLYFKF